MKNIVGLLLAAGSATRFGSDKLRHALPHGVSIAVQAARPLKAELSRVVAVVKPGSDELAAALTKESCEVVVCENAAEGMGASLACAARAAGECDGYLVALGDMPFLRRTSIAAIRDALANGAQLVAPYFRARRGHPIPRRARVSLHARVRQPCVPFLSRVTERTEASEGTGSHGDTEQRRRTEGTLR